MLLLCFCQYYFYAVSSFTDVFCVVGYIDVVHTALLVTFLYLLLKINLSEMLYITGKKNK